MKFAKLIDHMDLIPDLIELYRGVWPAFIGENPSPHTERILSDLAHFQLVALDDNTLAAAGNTVPIAWADNSLPAGWDGAIEKAMADIDTQTSPNTLTALSIGIHKDYRRQGVSRMILEAMKDLARENDMQRFIAPVRPTIKEKYPLTPMEQFMHWKRDDGLPFDPWLRAHIRCGGVIKAACNDSMTISGSVADWEHWCTMKFPQSGQYVIDRAVNPIEIDTDQNTGIYREANVWVDYQL